MSEITFKANPTQQAFITSKAEADLFACRMGEGKSAALVWCPFYHTQFNPGARWAIIRDTWENLRDTTLKEFFYWFPDGVAGHWKASEKLWVWDCEVPSPNGHGTIQMAGEIMWLGMDDAKDAAKLQSRALAGFCIDEPAPAALQGGVSEFVFQTAMTRLRQPNMLWYGAKLAENNPDESHWTYKTFVKPGYKGDPEAPLPPKQTRGYHFFQTHRPENLENLPDGYYENMEARFDRAGRSDLRDRFAKGDFGFQQPGVPVTPEFNKAIHVVPHLPVLDVPVTCLWDFGLNPTCIFTQVTTLSNWNIIEAYVGDGIGTIELIEDIVADVVASKYKGLTLSHIGDPQGRQREQSSAEQSAVRVIRDKLGGKWTPGPREWPERRDAAKRVLTKLRNGTGLVQIDEKQAEIVWHALRGGWYYRVHSNGHISHLPVKNDIHSHPGDAFSYGAAVLFPGGQERGGGNLGGIVTRAPVYFQSGRRYRSGRAANPLAIGGGAAEEKPPPDGSVMPGTNRRS